jgi:DnaJ-class molecular chaperone
MGFSGNTCPYCKGEGINKGNKCCFCNGSGIFYERDREVEEIETSDDVEGDK